MKWWGWLLVLLLLVLSVGEAIWLYLLLFDGMDAFPTSEDRRAGIWVALAIGLLMAGLFALLRRLTAPPAGQSRQGRRLERRILALAKKQTGRLTVAEVALYAKSTVQEADLALQELVRQGVATVYYTPNMEPVYVVGGFDNEAQDKAQDILNLPGGKP